ncbi:MAG: hypothetical protein JW737_02930 [Acidobacteria bacterium]|nr:hypothetical protein [Acidobacteriota bacterium]
MKKLILMVLVLSIVFTSFGFTENRYKKEYNPYNSRFFIGLNFGGFIPQEIYSIHTDLYIYNAAGYFENVGKFDPSIMFGGTIGFYITDNIGLKFDIDHVSVDMNSEFTLHLPDIHGTASTFDLTATVDGLTTNWTSFSADLIFRFKISSNLVFLFGGGVTYWMADIYAVDDYSWGWEGLIPQLAEINFETYETNYLGFNGFAMLEYFVDDDIAISISGKYMTASDEVTIPDIISPDPVEVTMGGIYAAIGLNLYI